MSTTASITFRWLAPADGGCPLLEYEVEGQPVEPDPDAPMVEAPAAGAAVSEAAGRNRAGGHSDAADDDDDDDGDDMMALMETAAMLPTAFLPTGPWRGVRVTSVQHCTATGLSPGHWWRFRVTARTRVGSSGAGAPSAVLRAERTFVRAVRTVPRRAAHARGIAAASLPAPPYPPVCTPMTPSTIRLDWRAPADNGLPVSRYRIRWRRVGAVGDATARGEASGVRADDARVTDLHVVQAKQSLLTGAEGAGADMPSPPLAPLLPPPT